jgi:predicted HTH domain antitoxin
MQLILPEAIETKLSPREAALHLAIGLFVSEEATLGQAAEIASMTQAAFLKELGRRRIPIHYGMEDLADDLKVVESFGN